jgi:Zn-dependent M16 (insulinase) family peptidase
MKTSLKKGQTLDSGFEILDVVGLAEFSAVGIYARHIKTKAEVFHVYNDDEENLFAYAFPTPPADSRGAAHIVEHSVLCGSKNYPLKDAFVVLAQGSLQTFLNAYTSADKTVYPAASTNEKDYFNLMAVYGDAVFNPLLDEWTFLQEGFRIEYGEDGNLKVNGVVYNEMKGIYSSSEEYVELWAERCVLPDTVYEHSPGGDPEKIVLLRYEDFKRFHAEHYTASACRVFLAGNIPTERQLAFLNDKFFAHAEESPLPPPVAVAEPWSAPRLLLVPAPDDNAGKTHVFVSWVCGDGSPDPEVDNLTLRALYDLLLGHDGSPVTHALIASGLGEDLSPVCGINTDIKQPVFTIGLRGVKFEKGKLREKAEEIYGLLRQILISLARDIPQDRIDAVLYSIECSNREIKRAGGPWSLVWLSRSLRGWIHGGKPWDTLVFAPRFEALKKKIAKDRTFFGNLIMNMLVNNPHHAIVALNPDKTFLSDKEKLLTRSLKAMDKSYDKATKQWIRDNARMLAERQNTPDSEEALRTIPHISVNDLSGKDEIIPRTLMEAGGIPLLSHKIFTNGLTYCEFSFPLDVIDPADYVWIPLFTHSACSMGLPGKKYSEVADILAQGVASFRASAGTHSIPRGSSRVISTPAGDIDAAGRDWLTFSLKTLDHKLEEYINIVVKMIKGADFSDTKRLREMTFEVKNQWSGYFPSSGMSSAVGRSRISYTRACGLHEIWGGFSAYEFMHRMMDYDIEEVSRVMLRMQKAVTEGGLFINVTGENPEAFSIIKRAFAGFTAPKPRNESCYADDLREKTLTPHGLADLAVAREGSTEIFAYPSMQVGFAARSVRGSDMGTREAAAETVLGHYLTTGPLWTKIRMKGGAYGADTQTVPLENSFTFFTVRDPKPWESLEVFADVLNDLRGRKIAPDELEKTVIGTFGGEKTPMANPFKGQADFIRFMYNITTELRERHLNNIIGIKADDITEAAERLYQYMSKGGYSVILAGDSTAAEAARALKTDVRKLPG